MTDIHDLLRTPHVKWKAVKKHIEAHPKCINTYDGDTSVLDRAVWSNRMDIVTLLVESGVDVNQQDKCGVNSLHSAIHEQNMDIIRYLIKSGADVNQTDKNGWSALHFAICVKNKSLVELLMEQGIDLSVKTKSHPETDIVTFAKSYDDQIASWLSGVLRTNEERLELAQAVKGAN